ncbi:hypothetical protein AK812_SmicGene34175 [Symbiodinium microadriaticum]|uniref:Uncharacterized protein n=1 Tax=Symbiodinium microadriaticum TaxID=2951 RepID=A0A1Q9CPQ8_SYMMI|nr:hypothetical protein AK812_SmicGene34175 [Symbiodinium microadriaticum]
MLADSGGPPPLLLDPFGAARCVISMSGLEVQSFIKGDVVEDNVLPEELQTTKAPPSLFVLLGEEYSGSAMARMWHLKGSCEDSLRCLADTEDAATRFSTGFAAPAASETANVSVFMLKLMHIAEVD